MCSPGRPYRVSRNETFVCLRGVCGACSTRHRGAFLISTAAGHPAPDDSYCGSRVESYAGACDGGFRAGRNDDFAIGPDAGEDLPFVAKRHHTGRSGDGCFAKIMAGTFLNRPAPPRSQTDRLDAAFALSSLPALLF